MFGWPCGRESRDGTCARQSRSCWSWRATSAQGSEKIPGSDRVVRWRVPVVGLLPSSNRRTLKGSDHNRQLHIYRTIFFVHYRLGAIVPQVNVPVGRNHRSTFPLLMKYVNLDCGKVAVRRFLDVCENLIIPHTIFDWRNRNGHFLVRTIWHRSIMLIEHAYRCRDEPIHSRVLV